MTSRHVTTRHHMTIYDIILVPHKIFLSRFVIFMTRILIPHDIMPAHDTSRHITRWWFMTSPITINNHQKITFWLHSICTFLKLRAGLTTGKTDGVSWNVTTWRFVTSALTIEKLSNYLAATVHMWYRSKNGTKNQNRFVSNFSSRDKIMTSSNILRKP